MKKYRLEIIYNIRNLSLVHVDKLSAVIITMLNISDICPEVLAKATLSGQMTTYEKQEDASLTPHVNFRTITLR